MDIKDIIAGLNALEDTVAKIKPLAALGGPTAAAVAAGVQAAVDIAQNVAQRVEEHQVVAAGADKAVIAQIQARLEAENDALAKWIDAP